MFKLRGYFAHIGDIFTNTPINQHREANGPASSQPPHVTTHILPIAVLHHSHPPNAALHHPHPPNHRLTPQASPPNAHSYSRIKKEEPFPIPLFCYRVIELLLSSFSTWFATFAVVSSASVTASVVALVVLSTCVSVNTCVRSKISLTVNLTVANPYFDT